jgi:hypothetical protein
MDNIITTATTPLTSCIAMPASPQESVLGAPVQGRRMAVGTAAHTGYAFGVQIAPAFLKDVSMGVRAWSPPN